MAYSNPHVPIAMPLSVCLKEKKKKINKLRTSPPRSVSRGGRREILLLLTPPIFWNFTPELVKPGKTGKKKKQTEK